MTSQILNLDCVFGLATIPDASIDLTIADPPYFRIHGDFDYGHANVEAYIEWAKEWIQEIARVSKPTASFYLWGKIGFGNGYPLMKIADWIEEEKLFQVVNWITQRNSRGRGTKRGYMEAREELVFMTKSSNYTWNPAYTEEKSTRKDLGFDGLPRKNTHKRCSDVWVDIAEASQSAYQRFYLPDGRGFPTVKAEGLCKRIIEASSNEGDRILVPFVGSGSECVVAARLNREYVGFEIDADYFKLAETRIANDVPAS